MKRLLLLFAACAGAASAQWVSPPATAYTTINTFLGSLVATNTGSGAPTYACTVSHDRYVDTSTTPNTEYYCSGSPNVWSKVPFSVLYGGTAVTVRSALNFIASTGITIGCVDNSGSLRTDCTFTSSGGSSVPSVFGRSGAVVAAANDYSFAQLSGSLAVGQIGASGTASSTTYLRGDYTWATVTGGVSTVFGRSGAVVAAANDYSFSQISGSLGHGQLPTLLTGDIPNNAANTSGNAATATALAATPTLCSTGQAPTGVLASGNAAGCAALVTSFIGRTGAVVAAANDYSFAQLSGSVAASQMPAITGDVTTVAGAVASTLATVNSGPGACGDATHVCQITTNGKGLATAQTAVSITAPVTSVFTRTGAVVAAANDYSFSQINGTLTAGAGGTGVSNTATLTLGTANQNWGALGTGIVKNTTATGGLSLAASADVYGLWSGTCSAVTLLHGAGACGAVVLTTDVSGVLPTANIAVALANQTSINGLGITASTGTLSITNAKTLAATNSLTLSGTDSTTMTFPSASATITQTIASGQTAIPVTALAANSCDASATTATATGGATTNAFSVNYASDPTGVTGYGGGTNGGITIRAWVISNTFEFKRCNETASSITPGALNLNWRITR